MFYSNSLKLIAKGIFMAAEELQKLREDVIKFAEKKDTTREEVNSLKKKFDQVTADLSANTASDTEQSAALTSITESLAIVVQKLNQGDIEGAKETAQEAVDNAPEAPTEPTPENA